MTKHPSDHSCPVTSCPFQPGVRAQTFLGPQGPKMPRSSLGHICSPSLLLKPGKGPVRGKGRWEVRHRQQPQLTDTAQLMGKNPSQRAVMCWNTNTEQAMGLPSGPEEMEWKDLQKQSWCRSPGTECSSSSSNKKPVCLLSCIVPPVSTLPFLQPC